jgi:hypothetical protein
MEVVCPEVGIAHDQQQTISFTIYTQLIRKVLTSSQIAFLCFSQKQTIPNTLDS